LSARELPIGQDPGEAGEVGKHVADLQEAVDRPTHPLVRVQEAGEVGPVEDLPMAEARHAVPAGLALLAGASLVLAVKVVLRGRVPERQQPVVDLLDDGVVAPAPRYGAKEHVRHEHQLIRYDTPVGVR
jgi:hypothetical protein